MTILILVMALAIGLAEGIPLQKNGRRKELVVMCLMLGLTFLLAVAYYFNLPSPLSFLQQLFEPIGNTIFKSI